MVEVDPIAHPGYRSPARSPRIQVGHITGKLPAERDLAREFGVIITRHGQTDPWARQTGMLTS